MKIAVLFVLLGMLAGCGTIEYRPVPRVVYVPAQVAQGIPPVSNRAPTLPQAPGGTPKQDEKKCIQFNGKTLCEGDETLSPAATQQPAIPMCWDWQWRVYRQCAPMVFPQPTLFFWRR